MDWTRRGFIAAGAIGVASPHLALAYPADAAMWEVRRGAAKVFLFGDGGPLRTPWRSARFEAALHESAVFWKETPDSGPGADKLFLAKGVDPARPLSTWLTPKDRERVAAAAAAVGLTSDFLERFRPWLTAVILDSNFRSHGGFKQDNGPEHDLIVIAKAAGKPIRSEFPDQAAIVDYFAAFSKAAEVGALLRAVDDIEAGPDSAERDAQAWASGDQRPELRQVRRIGRAYPEYYQQILVARNRRWAGRIRAMLDAGGTTFVLAGGDHLIGPDSVQNQLAAAGMTARRI
ncbi:MAG: TraB/GumN family protein [Caulobacterales bacterium]